MNAGEEKGSDQESTDDKEEEENEGENEEEGSDALEAIVEQAPVKPPLPLVAARNRVSNNGGPGGPALLPNPLNPTNVQGASPTLLSPLGASSTQAPTGIISTSSLPSSILTNNATSSSSLTTTTTTTTSLISSTSSAASSVRMTPSAPTVPSSTPAKKRHRQPGGQSASLTDISTVMKTMMATLSEGISAEMSNISRGLDANMQAITQRVVGIEEAIQKTKEEDLEEKERDRLITSQRSGASSQSPFPLPIGNPPPVQPRSNQGRRSDEVDDLIHNTNVAYDRARNGQRFVTDQGSDTADDRYDQSRTYRNLLPSAPPGPEYGLDPTATPFFPSQRQNLSDRSVIRQSLNRSSLGYSGDDEQAYYQSRTTRSRQPLTDDLNRSTYFQRTSEQFFHRTSQNPRAV